MAFVAHHRWISTEELESPDTLAGDGFFAVSEATKAKLPHPLLRELFNYWQEKSGTRSMPSREDMKAADLTDYWRFCTICEVINGGHDFRFVYIGTEIVKYFGEHTGALLSEIDFPVALKRRIKIPFEAATRLRRPISSNFHDMILAGDNHLTSASIIFPLAGDGRSPDRVLSVGIIESRN